MYKQISIITLSMMLLMGCSGTVPTLGINNSQLTPCPNSPNCVNSQQTSADEEHAIAPLYFSGTQQQAQVRLLHILKTAERANIVVVEDDYIRVEFTSQIMRFVDDVEFYFPSTAADKITIHVRSASRIGSSDFGVNRERIEKIRGEFNAFKPQ
ncbi:MULTISPECIES: DUF1499 domain-containing protein [Shewanella]|uniref:DUF1499 domain-containing protein n=1 Tax=Shewanella TaxID=22 RepID=UPI000C48FDA3|nr:MULTISPECIES: DUF1499 domain-containing protein [Shewanella]NCQ45192.1 DUF1499 domain-containing protein [Shewanella frigidimarina]MBB1323312.1 DUF1499 domain-containing protein [Shewanella sp. SR43-8]MBB1475501.1 DUF1499 domain-containing protein [Shewanella sp. SG41-3]NCO70820.1 DUF1499 domain-containing protein [Shewanella vesiculosa]NCP36937.1 DUF1499 domain-containing protein [Shewanella vesiculosa]